MSDELGGAPSNGAGDASLSADTTVSTAVTSEPAVTTSESAEKPVASSSREALARAMADAGMGNEDSRTDRGDGRDATGKFVSKEPKLADGAASPPTSATEAKEGALPTVQTPPLGQAPSGFSKAAQADWAKTPDSVRADTERRITELTSGLEQWKAVAEPVREFDEIARQSGTTLRDALTNYYHAEQGLRQNPVLGTVQIWQRLGVDPHRMLKALIEGFGGAPQNGQQPQGASPEVVALQQKLNAYEQRFGNIEQTIQQTTHSIQQERTQTVVEKFASDPAHPYFDDLAPTISQLIAGGVAKDLPTAYDKAVLLNPEIAAKIAADKTANEAVKPDPAQTRKASLSITGTPSAGSHPATRPPAGSSREALQRAAASLGI